MALYGNNEGEKMRDNRFLRVADVARFLGCSVATLEAWMGHMMIETHLGKMIDEEELDAYIEVNKG